MKPKIVCICGSTRFADFHAIKRWELERDGKVICLMINYLPAWYGDKQGWNGNNHFGEQAGNKDILDELHLRKIDLADEVFVINKNGYIGESTKREIEYAKAKGKPVRYLETKEGFIHRYWKNIQRERDRREDCPVCHGAGATTDHHDPCTECGGSGRVEEE